MSEYNKKRSQTHRYIENRTSGFQGGVGNIGGWEQTI